MTQIAQRLGYDNPANFVRAFKALSGYTPTEFKNLKSPLRSP